MNVETEIFNRATDLANCIMVDKHSKIKARDTIIKLALIASNQTLADPNFNKKLETLHYDKKGEE